MRVDEQVAAHNGAARALILLQFAYPVILFTGFLVTFIIHSIRSAPKVSPEAASLVARGPGGKLLPDQTSRPPSEQRELHIRDYSPAKKALFNWLTVGVTVSILLDAVLITLHALMDRRDGWWCGENGVVYVVGSFVIYVLLLLSLVSAIPSPNWTHAFTWMLSLAMEIALLGLAFSLHLAGKSTGSQWRQGPDYAWHQLTRWDSLEIAVQLFRVLCLALLVAFWSVFSIRGDRHSIASRADSEERTSLLDSYGRRANGRANQRANGFTAHSSLHGDADPVGNGHGNGLPKSYGATHDAQSTHIEETKQKDGWVRPDKMPERGWYEYLRSYSLFFPYLWPARSRKLQLTVVACFTLVFIVRLINVYVPLVSGKIVNQLTSQDGEQVQIPWATIGLYICLRALQGSSGLLSSLRSVLWIPVGQYSYRELATAAFEHVHGLSLDFHLNKKTGEVISALNKGGSINNFLETVTFNLVPMLIDMIIAIFYFLSAYDTYYALTLFVMVIAYIFVTIKMTQTRVHQRRAMANLDREEQAVKNDSLMSYETVKYFNAEDREFARYRDAVKAYQKAEYRVYFSLQALNICQMGIFMLGLLVTCLIAAYQVANKRRDVGSFVTLITYMTQLQSPLNYFGTFYRSMQSSMINAERLLELFKQQPTVEDMPEARELKSCRGEISCEDVEFAYDSRHPALRGVNFKCAPGTTTALVGESGGGKSTLFRLLFRFYNITGGRIEVDGADVRDITVDSLRRHIGVVPQDTILFNESVMYNLRYANPDATDEDVFAACRAACIHEKILSFPDGYDSKVGERGLKLSGGEKQRVAIARTIIKNPRIILLDEATAALDTDTEDHIQQAFKNLQEDRTTLIIAHRLSTITKCDQILVLNGGRIVEVGTHQDLVDRGGRYANLWRKQMKANKVDMEISRLENKARRLRENEGDDSPSASQSEDERSTPSGEPWKGQDGSNVRTSSRSHKRQGSNLANTVASAEDEDDNGPA